MHVHGHIPAGMRTTDAIADGYDEITHIYFVMMQAMPDSVVKVSNGIARMEGPGRYAKDIDLNAAPMKSIDRRDGGQEDRLRSHPGGRGEPPRRRRTAIWAPPTRRSSAPCRRPSSAASARAD